MKLYMKQKVFSWTDKFAIKDEMENDRFSVQGEFLSIGKKLHIYDAGGTEVAFIRQKVLAFLPRYIVEIDGQEVCQIVKQFTLLKPRYELEGIPWHVKGDFWAHEYAMYDESEQLVMQLSKHWFTWGDSYELDITNDKDALLCVCVTLAVDAAISSESASASASVNVNT